MARNLPFLILNLGLYIIDCVRGLNLKGDRLAGEGLYENLHGVVVVMDMENTEDSKLIRQAYISRRTLNSNV